MRKRPFLKEGFLICVPPLGCSAAINNYQPALYWYVKMWANFKNNKPNAKSPFKLGKNDLIDSFILFSIVPDDNVFLVTDEKKVHQLFSEIGYGNAVCSLDEYLEKIGFC